jgi:pyruvate,water dikinase
VDEFSTVKPGDILICRTTDPAWTPLFGLAAAIVTETGGLLSHAAIVAREYGIPAVLGVAGALDRFPAGTTIVVDGTQGTVTEAPVKGP